MKNLKHVTWQTLGECKSVIGLSYQGFWGYVPLVVNLANIKEALYLVNRSGNAVSHQDSYGRRMSELGLLGVIAIRMTGKKLLYNERAMRFTNCPEAPRLLNPPYRNGWELA